MQADRKSDEIPRKIPEEILTIFYTELVLSLILTLFKLLAGFLGNSNLLLADSIRSFSEFINRCIRLLDFFIASKPEDKSHNYGHGKITTLFMGAGAFILLFESFYASFLSSGELLMFLQGKEPEVPEITTFYAAIIAFVLSYIMIILTENSEIEAKKASSKARTLIKDLLIPGFVIPGIGCTFLPGRGFDIAHSFAAFFLSLYLLGTSGRLFYRTANELIEASLEENENLRIREIINKTENVAGSGELKTRRIGKGIAINACVRVNNSLSICEAAEIAGFVEERLEKAFAEDTYINIKIEPSPEKILDFKNRGRPSEESEREKVTLF